MVKKVFKKFLPDRDYIEKHGGLHHLGDWILEPNLWHINRHSASAGLANGLFCAFAPIPAGQMFVASVLAIFLRVNIPISILGVWLTNPITMGPMFYAAYRTGASILNYPLVPLEFELSWEWFSTTLVDIWVPLFVGCFIYGTVAAVFGYFLVQWLWRFSAVRRWEQRKEKMRQQKMDEGSDSES